MAKVHSTIAASWSPALESDTALLICSAAALSLGEGSAVFVGSVESGGLVGGEVAVVGIAVGSDVGVGIGSDVGIGVGSACVVEDSSHPTSRPAIRITARM